MRQPKKIIKTKTPCHPAPMPEKKHLNKEMDKQKHKQKPKTYVLVLGLMNSLHTHE